MELSSVRRVHATVAARFDASPTAVWSLFEDFANAHGGSGASTEMLAADSSRWIRRAPADLGVVEERRRSEDGLAAYRARVPGGSAFDDLDAVVRVSQEGEGSVVTWSTQSVDNRSASERERLQQWLAERLRSAGGTVLSPLTMDVWLGEYRTIARAGLGGGAAATWSPTTATLVAGQRDAVLIDALMTAEEGEQLVEWIRASGKRLRAVIITQGQADHFFGLDQVLRAFPDVVATAVTDVAQYAQAQTQSGLKPRWETLFPGKLPTTVTAPSPLPAGSLDLEGHSLQLFDVGLIGERPTSVVSVRHLDAMIGGDLVYNRVHPWLIGTDRGTRQRWSRALDLVEALRPAWVIASHRDPDENSDAALPQVEEHRRYLREFDEVLASASDARSFVEEMVGRWPNHGNRSTLEASAVSQFVGGRALAPADYPDLLPQRPENERDAPG